MRSLGKTRHIYSAVYALVCAAMIVNISSVAVAATATVVIGGSAAAATLALSPASGSYATGNIFSVNIALDTQSNPVQGVDVVYLNYNPALLEVQDDDAAVAGAQIAPGTLMATTALNSVDTAAGKIAFSQVTASGASYTGSGTLATVRFKALTSGTAAVTFDFTQGSTIDTNVASNGADILASVTNGSYAVAGGAVPPQQDTTPPARTSGAPSGTFAAGTTHASLSVATSESATCKYNATSGASYGSMASAFTATGGTSHSTIISGLANATAYAYYVRCADAAGNANTDDYTISFSIAAPASAPTSGGGGGGGGSYTPPAATAPAPTPTQSPTPAVPASQQQAAASPFLPAGVREGDLVRGPDGIKVYIVNFRGYKRHIFNPAVFSMYGHFKWDQIKTVDQKTLDAFITSDLYRADGDTRVFSLHELDEKKGLAQKRWLSVSGERFVALGYTWEQVFIINTKERDYYQEGSPITDSTPPQAPVASISAGALVKTADNPTVYYITNTGLKKRIVNATVFNSYSTNRWENIKIVMQSQLDSYPTVNTMKLSGSTKVYVLEGDMKRWVKAAAAFQRLGLDWNKVVTVNQTEFNAYADGAPIE